MLHKLKTWPKPFSGIINRTKTHEVRINDRGFQVGDELLLVEWNPEKRQETGNTVLVSVTYLTQGGSLGLPENLVVMSVLLQSWACPNKDAMTE